MNLQIRIPLYDTEERRILFFKLMQTSYVALTIMINSLVSQYPCIK